MRQYKNKVKKKKEFKRKDGITVALGSSTTGTKKLHLFVIGKS